MYTNWPGFLVRWSKSMMFQFGSWASYHSCHPMFSKSPDRSWPTPRVIKGRFHGRPFQFILLGLCWISVARIRPWTRWKLHFKCANPHTTNPSLLMNWNSNSWLGHRYLWISSFVHQARRVWAIFFCGRPATVPRSISLMPCGPNLHFGTSCPFCSTIPSIGSDVGPPKPSDNMMIN